MFTAIWIYQTSRTSSDVKYYISETKYKDMRSQPGLKEKQGKEVRTSKIIAEKHRYPRLGTVILLHSERDTETGWDTRHLPALSREAEHNCYGRILTTRRQAIVSLRESDTLHSLTYLGAHLLVGKGSYLIHTANQKNATLNLDFAKSVTNLAKT